MSTRVKCRDLVAPMTIVFMLLLLVVVAALEQPNDAVTMSANADQMTKTLNHGLGK